MLPTKRNPVPLVGGPGFQSFLFGKERAGDTHNSLRFQARTLATSHRLTQQADFASLGDLTARLLTKLEARRRG
jgi:hypothetical protein